MDGISIIVCSYNGASRLPSTLLHLANQVTSNLSWEIILVDNNSTDGTTVSANSLWETSGLSNIPLITIMEKRPGVSFARYTGINESIYDYIIFCDDDNWLDCNYIQKAYDIMSSDSELYILGGLNKAVADVPFPAWFKEVEHAYACGPQAARDGDAERQFITTAGMVIRKNTFSIFEQIGFESQFTSRKGTELSSGEDSEMCFVALMLGHKIAYTSQLQLQHYMETKRLNWNYFIALTIGHAKSGYKLQYYQFLLNKSHFNPNWFREFIRITRPFLCKQGAITVWHYFKAKRKPANISAVYDMMEVQKWLTHLAISGEYSHFIHSINKLYCSASQFKTNKEHISS